jgi:hypothetical protein
MDPLFVQNLRYKLQKRIGRLNSVEPGTFHFALIQFWRFFDEQPMFVGISAGMLAQVPDYETSVDRIFAGEQLHGSTEVEAAALGYGVLRRLAGMEELAFHRLPYTRAARSGEKLDLMREIFLDPFYEYVDEQLDDQRAMLALLLRYKHRSEWFHRERLFTLCQEETAHAENRLALDLYAFLYDQGIDFTIEPSSITGEVDLIAAQNTPDPLLLDAKVFDGDGRGKVYLRKGFGQVYTYTQQHNEAFGYLVIYKTTDRDLRFALRRATEIPVVVHNHKTIFMITVDIFPHDKPVSQRRPLQAIEITEEELTGMLDVDATGAEQTKG